MRLPDAYPVGEDQPVRYDGAKTQDDHLQTVNAQVSRLRDVAGTEGYPQLAGAIADIGEAVAFLLAKPKVGRPPREKVEA